MKKNILVIDDSALMRRVISDIIKSDDRYQVSGLAANGLEGFDLLTRKSFDVAILDINMPKMNGLELLEKLRKHNVKTKIIVVSTVAKEGAVETIRALELGAFDFVTKPDSFYETKTDSFRIHVIDAIACAIEASEGFAQTPQREAGTAAKRSVVQPKLRNRIADRVRPITKSSGNKLVALACSTGGPKALQSIIPYLPENLNAPILIVQHMPEGFTRSLANRLNEMSKISVKEAEDGDIIEKGNVYIAKGGHQMSVVRKDSRYKLSITKDEPRNGLRPCADIMYESLVNSDYHEIICVVLTGMGSDGTKGITQLNNSNSIYVVGQNAETSTVYGMPKVIADAGLVDEVRPLNEIANSIINHVGVQ
ncbi:chemotaxis-specific protein-glutamate methyltransferase CheB [Anaeromicropila populeti]|uniref:Protein-glutamate methylesterase/protein-glutamine glutaminase n=1 Tax=Anaeromicropila populeti TaxID=37658 RepID=A0A1I6KXM3_9FIRM|nr:chemotaxis-specific protein-glutamate methyltransferase CheB [Anaeromicropila populeti]SFR95937.1 two-component system, chemotaxis family, response regulator CheB [Anaeromicropila populeti]